MAEKRYFWLKLKEDFFTSNRIKKLRRLAGGDTYLAIYLKMQLKSINDGGYLRYTGLEPSFAEELALDIDESVDDVKATLAYLANTDLIRTDDNINFFLPYAAENTASETTTAHRVRAFRERQKGIAELPEALHCNADVTQVKRECNGDIDTDIRDRYKSVYFDNNTHTHTRGKPPLQEEIIAYCKQNNLQINVQRFFDTYSASGWKRNGQPIEDWQAVARLWAAEDAEKRSDNKTNADSSFEFDDFLKAAMSKTKKGV